jgi:uncharacterized membrane protein YkoI
MRISRGCWHVAAAVGVLCVAGALFADEQKITLDKVPGVVKRACKAKYPRAQVSAVTKETEDGKTTYEFKLSEGDKKWEATFDSEGKFEGTEEVIAESDIPDKVSEGLKTKYPGAKILKAEKETKGEGDSAKIVYEMVIQAGDKKMEVQFDPSGKFIAEEAKK